MAKIRVYDLAKELGLESRDVLERAHALGLEPKTASSSLDDEAADLIRLAREEETSTEEPAPEPPPETTAEEVEPEPVVETPPQVESRLIEVPIGVTPTMFAERVGAQTGEVVKALLQMGEVVPATGPIPGEALDLIAEQFGVQLEKVAAEPLVQPFKPAVTVPEDDEASLRSRPPVVTVMGHVDHGKTTLLDTIRKTNVVGGEHGGITQHIGAYQVEVGGRRVTFIDTPGHEAFTALRARGAEATDIVVLVVAADDGVMPQTAEAISHTKAAEVPMIVAINKSDLPAANPTSVRAALTEFGVIAEELGGDVTTVEVSALTGDGVDELVEVLDLTAQLEDLKANPDAEASGVVIESQLDTGRGPVATLIVQRGTLHQGDAMVAGVAAGRVRAMLNDSGDRVKEAEPSTPVLTMGWDELPAAGDRFEVVGSEKEARAIAQQRTDELRQRYVEVPNARERLEQLLEQLRTSDDAELRLIIKADAHGSLEAIRDSLARIGREGGRITLMHTAVGGITEQDVKLAEVTDAIVIGFGVRPDPKARKLAEQISIEIRTYRIIYELLDEVEQMLVGRLAPTEEELVRGSAEVRALFRVPRVGVVAGCYVTEGEMLRGARSRLLRDSVVVYDGSVASLRRFKEDVRQVSAGFECGIGLAGFNDIKEGDVIEVYEVREVPRT
ncbi:MAG TPA: translation initiation factor IF-2 [Acidimicrobiia bacterium]|nr:translation initiation factor IF-2 [Acidimicrobiia bacterium]